MKGLRAIELWHPQMVFEPAVAAHQGRIVKLIGVTIVEFASVVDAVNCALSVQRPGDSLQDESLHQPRIVLRIPDELACNLQRYREAHAEYESSLAFPAEPA